MGRLLWIMHDSLTHLQADLFVVQGRSHVVCRTAFMMKPPECSSACSGDCAWFVLSLSIVTCDKKWWGKVLKKTSACIACGSTGIISEGYLVNLAVVWNNWCLFLTLCSSKSIALFLQHSWDYFVPWYVKEMLQQQGNLLSSLHSIYLE